MPDNYTSLLLGALIMLAYCFLKGAMHMGIFWLIRRFWISISELLATIRKTEQIDYFPWPSFKKLYKYWVINSLFFYIILILATTNLFSLNVFVVLYILCGFGYPVALLVFLQYQHKHSRPQLGGIF